jgi:hypothetical protein
MPAFMSERELAQVFVAHAAGVSRTRARPSLCAVDLGLIIADGVRDPRDCQKARRS